MRFDQIRLLTCEIVVYSLLNNNVVDEVLTDTDRTLCNMGITITDTSTSFIFRIMKSSLCFGVVYSKSQILPILVGGRLENLCG